MILELDTPQSEALAELLDRHLGDMSAEIAATDNPQFRRELKARRDAIRGIREQLMAGTISH